MANPFREAWLRFEDPLTLFVRAATKLHSLWLRYTYPFAYTGRNLSIHFSCTLHRPSASQIRLGDSVIIGRDSLLYIVPDEVADVKLAIDDNCVLGARSVISAKNLIHIEQDVVTGTSVLIQDHQHTHQELDIPIRYQGVTAGGRIRIERGCWIGQGAIIVCNEGEKPAPVLGGGLQPERCFEAVRSDQGTHRLIRSRCPAPAYRLRRFKSATGLHLNLRAALSRQRYAWLSTPTALCPFLCPVWAGRRKAG